MNLKDCHNFSDFRTLAKKKLPSPIFHYIDGAADDEITYARNTSAFDDVDLEVKIWGKRKRFGMRKGRCRFLTPRTNEPKGHLVAIILQNGLLNPLLQHTIPLDQKQLC